MSAIKDLINDVGCSVLNDGEGELEYGPKLDAALDELATTRLLLVDVRTFAAKIVRENAGPIWVVHKAYVLRDSIDEILKTFE